MLDNPSYQPGEVTVNGVTVRYRTAGSVNDRLPLVLVHGTAGSIDGHYGYIFPMMAFRQRVIALDWSDTGGDQLELEDLVAQVRAVIEAEVPEGPVALMGYSLGAVVAAQAAAEMGEKIANLILVAGWLKTDTQQAVRNHVWQALRREDSPTLTEFMTLCAFSPAFMKSRTPEEILAAAKMLAVDEFVDRQMGLNTRIDIAEAAATITARTLVVGCTYDMMVPRHHSKLIFGTIDDARYAEIPSGHGVVHERPAELFSHVDHFTSQPDAFPAGSIIPAQRP